MVGDQLQAEFVMFELYYKTDLDTLVVGDEIKDKP